MTDIGEHNAAVTEAVERLYQVFARYPLPRSLDASPLRDVVAILRALHSAPLRKLGAEQVLPYASWAMTTVGGPDEYKHFLPRVIELALDDPPHLGAEPWVIADKVTYRPYANRWSEEELAAVRAVFLAAFARILMQHPEINERKVLSWFEGLCALGFPSEALQTWRRFPSRHAIPHFASFIVHLYDYNEKNERYSAFWKDVSEFLREEDFQTWFYSFPIPEDSWILHTLERAYDILGSNNAEVDPSISTELE